MASTESISELATARTLLFRVGSAVHGCDISVVREIVPLRRATRLPGAPPFVHGLINLRGTIVTVLDLGRRLDAARPALTEGSIILVGRGTKQVGVAVEEVMDVRNLAVDDTAAGAESASGIVRGLGHADELVVIVLDMDTLIKQVLLS